MFNLKYHATPKTDDVSIGANLQFILNHAQNTKVQNTN